MKAINVVLGMLAGLVLASAQTGSQFEVASLKVAAPGGGRGGMRGGPGTNDPTRFSWPSATLQHLLMKAYNVGSDQISGPGWITEDHYAVVANVPADATKEQFDLMLRNLLISRFQLTSHTSTKTFSIYELGVAPGGTKLTAVASAPMEDAPDAGPQNQPRPAVPAPLGNDGCPVLPAGKRGQQGHFDNGMMCSTFRNTTITDLLISLETFVAMEDAGMMTDRAHVVDKTGLTGEYDFTLKFSFVMRFPGQSSPSADPGNGPDIATALEKQIGLRLQKSKASLEMIVIDHAERVPADN
jgi:uncharacterized protein (TIGR03435 family)